MAIKNEKDFPLCKDCILCDIDFELRKNNITCAKCQLSFYTKELFLPIVKVLNKILEKINNWLRRK